MTPNDLLARYPAAAELLGPYLTGSIADVQVTEVPTADAFLAVTAGVTDAQLVVMAFAGEQELSCIGAVKYRDTSLIEVAFVNDQADALVFVDTSKRPTVLTLLARPT